MSDLKAEFDRSEIDIAAFPAADAEVPLVNLPGLSINDRTRKTLRAAPQVVRM